MSMPMDKTFRGKSRESFAAAAQDAVDQWESDRGGPPDEETTLRVVEMYVTVRNPIHDYIVVLGAGG
jgi:hypothetical protein